MLDIRGRAQSVLEQLKKLCLPEAQVSADQYNHLQYEREADQRKWQGEMQSRNAELQRLQVELQRLASELAQRWVSIMTRVCLAFMSGGATQSHLLT